MLRWFGTIVCLLSFLPLVVISQSVGNYVVSRSTGITYNSIISTGNTFASWRYNGAFSMDDNRSHLTDIGFDFWYNGVRYTQFSVSTNGYLDFSSSTDDGGPVGDDFGYINTAFTASAVGSATRPALAPFYDDMTTQGGVDPLGNSIKYQLTGSTPNRVLTIEWDNMAVYLNTTPDLNFQVKLYESSGNIEYVYETMTQGTNTFSYTCGINAENVSAPPTANELLAQQTANTTTFTNTVQNNLSTMPTSNSMLTFNPPAPSAAPTGLSFSSVTSTGMTLNWTDAATNEVGYVLYISTDDTEYFFQVQTAAGATSSVITGLLPSTTYYWRVYAVTEGELSTALSGSQATLGPGTIVSAQNGRWNNTGTWVGGVVPGAGDNVSILDGHRVTLRSNNEACYNLTVGQGTSGQLRLGNNGTSRTLSVGGDITINTGGQIYTNTASNTTHTLNVQGDIINSGTFNMQSDANSLCLVNFNSTLEDQTVSGSGGTTQFYTIDITKGQMSKVLEITSTNFTCDPDAVTIVDGGTFKFSSASTISATIYNSTREIPAKGKIWMNSASSTLSFAGGVNLSGELILDNGTVNVGNAADENLISFGGKVEVNGGNLNVAGRYDRNNSDATSNFTLAGGTMTVPTSGSTSTTRAPFAMDVDGSTFNMSSGTIVIEREGGGNDLGFVNTGSTLGTVTGGTLEIGNGSTPAGQTMEINSSKEIGSLTVNSANATAELATNNITIVNDVLLTAGTLEGDGQNINIGGNWTNNGGTYTGGTNVVTFDGTTQSIGGTSGSETFDDVTVAVGSTVSIASSFSVSVTGNTTNSGTLDNDGTVDLANGYSGNTGTLSGDGTHRLSGGNWNNTGTFTAEGSTVEFTGSSAQTIQGTSQFNNLTINNSSGVSITADNHELIDSLKLISGTFTTNNAFTLISNASGTARIGEITGGAISGDVTAQQYLSSSNDDWRILASPVSGTGVDVEDWNDDFWMSGFAGSDYPTNSFLSMYTYNETTLGDLDQGYEVMSSTSDLLVAGDAYYTWVGDLPVGTGITTTLDLTGPVNTGNITVTTTYTDDPAYDDTNDGWNLVGNPYPSQIMWDDVNLSANLTPFAYVYNPATSSYLTFDQSSSSVIAQQQGFWVKMSSAGNGTITFEETDKTATVGTFKSSSINTIELTVDGMGYSNSTQIRMNENASSGYDPNYDAFKIYSPDWYAPDLMTVSSDNVELSINSVQEQDSISTSIPVKMITGYQMSGNYTLSIEDSTALLNHPCLYLEDLHLDSMIDLRTSTTYDFFISDTVMTARFMLHIGFPVKVEKQDLICYGEENGELLVEGSGNGPWNFLLIEELTTDTVLQTAAQNELSLQNLAPNFYVVKVQNSDGSCAATEHSVRIDAPSKIHTAFEIDSLLCSGDDNATISIYTTGGISPYSYLWGMGANESTLTGLVAGNYVVSTSDVNDCIIIDTIHVIEPLALELNTTVQNVTCFGDENGGIKLEAEGGSLPYTFLWSTNDSVSNLNHLSSGIYSCTITDKDGCTSQLSEEVTSPDEIIALFELSADTVKEGDTLAIDNLSQGANNYSWNFGDGNVSSDSTPTHVFEHRGQFNIILVASNESGCEKQYNKLVTVEDKETVGGKEILPKNEVDVWSLRNKIYIETSSGFDLKLEAAVYNEVGQKVVERITLKEDSDKKYVIPMQGVSPGIYYIELRSQKFYGVYQVYLF